MSLGSGDDETLPKLLLRRAAENPEAVAFRHKRLGIWQPCTWRDYADRVGALALGLRDLGVGRGDRVAILSGNRPEWVFADLAATSLGAIAVGVYPTCSAVELGELLRDCGAVLLVAEDQEQVDKALAVIDDCPDLRHVVVIEASGVAGAPGYDHAALSSYDDVTRQPETGESGRSYAELAAATGADDVACIIYTSGTSGPPKGAMLTHRATLSAASAFGAALGVTRRDVHLSVLPLCHLADRVWTLYLSLQLGVTIGFPESPETVAEDTYELAPTFFGAVPRTAEKMLSRVTAEVAAAGRLKRASYELWMRVGRRLARRRLQGGGALAPLDRILYGLGWLALYRPLRERLGLRRVRHCIVGTAPVAPDVLEFFHAIGLRMVQCYGLTEAGGTSHMHLGWDITYDTVGRVIGDYEAHLDPDSGEVLLSGTSLFTGYWGDPDASAAALDGKGRLRTGDVGELDDAGHLRISGRLKDVIITSGGKNISPLEIENRLRFSPYVRDAVVIGDARPYLVALIGIDTETVGRWARDNRVPHPAGAGLAALPEVGELVGDWVSQVNDRLARVSAIKRFRLLPRELGRHDGELTPTHKLRRAAIQRNFASLVEEMYR